MASKVAVVIPTYKTELSPLEQISLTQCRKILGKYPIIFVAPEGKNFPYIAPNEMIAQFPPRCFQSVASYSRLMLSPNFYETFAEFEYILIYQLDAFVFYDALEYFCSLGYDYIGAPWPRYAWRPPDCSKKISRVGNGGLSLRNVRACHKVLTLAATLPNWTENMQFFLEDSFFATCGALDDMNFHLAPVEIAEKFSMEWHPDRAVKKLGNCLPFGCHNWHRFGVDFYVAIFKQLGYDLSPWREQMPNNYHDVQTWLALEFTAMRRLIRRTERGQSILRYLPTKKFASVNVLRSPDAMKILSRLLWENILAEKIFIHEMTDAVTVLDNIGRENLPHLLLTSEDDDKVIDYLEQRGLIYGKHIISFRREYLQRCEELFHRLGK